MENVCEFCGLPLREGSQFCVQCGQPVSAASAAIEPLAPAPQRQPSSLPAAQIVLHVTLRPDWRTTSVLDLYLDDKPIGQGSFKDGVDVRTPTETGRYILSIVAQMPLARNPYQFPITVSGEKGRILIEIKFNPFLGTFKLKMLS